MFEEKTLTQVSREEGREEGREEMLLEQFNNLIEALGDKDKVLGILAKSLKKSKKDISEMLKL